MALIAKVAVSAAVVSIDKAYDYKVPEPWQGQVERGRRVMVPFGKGNHLTEGFVLDVVRQRAAGPAETLGPRIRWDRRTG